jgi:hypothetical protein
MPEKSTALILHLHMHESHDTWGDRTLRGRFDAWVYGQAASPRYEGSPTQTLYAYDSPWARFAMNAFYGDMDLRGGNAYGFEWGFEPEYQLVKVGEIDRIAKGLKKVERAVDKLCADYGRPQSLGQDVVYVMRALGIQQACWQLPEGRARGGEYRDWRVARTMEEVRYHIDSTIDACRQKQLNASAA